MIRRIQAIMRSYLVKNAPPKERKSEIMPNQSNTIQIKNQEVGELKNDDNIDENSERTFEDEIIEVVPKDDTKSSLNDSPPKIREHRPKVEYDNGCVYEGEWSTITNLRDGYGILIWPDGSKYEGEWANDKANGDGKLTHSDGDIYEGEWLNDKSHGYGTFYYSDGSVYAGDWK